MTAPDLEPESRVAVYRAVAEIRESLFRLADSPCGLDGFAHVRDLLQTANFSLGRAEAELMNSGEENGARP
jgi:hypothetical protein